ncbi:MAG: hypothetical protein GX542_04510 [Rhodococcus sp.]|nr:hypothetical protein [Rhodococcus sp. (in: high G+C Gram-positive bacteria)]
MTGEVTASWVLSAGQFVALWEAARVPTMPYPMQYRPGGRSEPSALDALRAIIDWERDLDDDKLRTTIDVLAKPELSVSLSVLDSLTQPPTFQRRVAVRGKLVVLIDQGPDRDIYAIPDGDSVSGDISLRVQRGTNGPDLKWLADELLAGIPDAEPGRTPHISALPSELNPQTQPGGSVLQKTIATSTERMREMLAKRGGGGYLIIHGPRVGATDPILDSLMWLDVADDGRYLQTEDHKITLQAARLADVARELERRVQRALTPPTA